MRVRFLLCLLLMFPAVLPGDEYDEELTESVVIFNTICAKCHEAECSGRMSFHEAYEQAVQHIVRHYNGASGKVWMQKQLYRILNHMKQKCAYYPLQVTVPPQRVWGREILSKLATVPDQNYFIPVGSLDPGDYQLVLTLDEDTRLTVHVVSEAFEMAVEDCYSSNGGQIVIPFTIEAHSNYYVRLYPNIPVRMKRLEITPAR